MYIYIYIYTGFPNWGMWGVPPAAKNLLVAPLPTESQLNPITK